MKDIFLVAGEKILWQGKPKIAVFTIKKSFVQFWFGIIWMTILILFIYGALSSFLGPKFIKDIQYIGHQIIEETLKSPSNESYGNETITSQLNNPEIKNGLTFLAVSGMFLLPFFLFGMFFLLMPLFAFLEAKNTTYYITNKRIVVYNKSAKKKLESYYFNSIKSVEDSIDFLDKIFNTETINFYTDKLRYTEDYVYPYIEHFFGIKSPTNAYNIALEALNEYKSKDQKA